MPVPYDCIKYIVTPEPIPVELFLVFCFVRFTLMNITIREDHKGYMERIK
jgi:hypothetical protein